jgi:hypothetical protein
MERLIDRLYDPALHGDTKPRTYRKVAQKRYLSVAQKKNKSKKVIRGSTRTVGLFAPQHPFGS